MKRYLIFIATILLFIIATIGYTQTYPRASKTWVITAAFDYDTTDLASDGDTHRECLNADYDGRISQIRVYKSGASCTSVEWWIIEEDVAVATAKSNLTIAMDIEDSPQTADYATYQPAGSEVYFKSTNGKLCVEAKANGGACNFKAKVYVKRFE